MTVLSQLELARLVVAHFPAGVVPQTGHGIRETAYAVASAESGRLVEAQGDDFGSGPQSFGLWQVYLPAHPEYSREGLLTADGAASAAYAISQSGLNWNPWCTWEPSACGGAGRSSYLSYLPEARLYVAQAAVGGGGATGLLTGSVGGPFGAIAGAALSVQGGPTGYSGASGAFTLTDVPVGRRVVTVSAGGYLSQGFAVDVAPTPTITPLYPALAAAPGPGPAPAGGGGSALLPVLLLAGGIFLATTLTRRQPQITIIKKLPPGALPPGATLQKAITIQPR